MEDSSIETILIHIRKDIENYLAVLLDLEPHVQITQASTLHNDVFDTIRRSAKIAEASIHLCDLENYSASISLLRTGLEQCVANYLNLRETNFLIYKHFKTKEDADKWVNSVRISISDSSDYAMVQDPVNCGRSRESICVPIVVRNVERVSEDSNLQPLPGARLLAVVAQHRHDLSGGGDNLRPLVYPFYGEENARKVQRENYQHYFKWSSLLKALEIQNVLSRKDTERLKRHYNYLSLFVHGTSNTDEYLRISGISPRRNSLLIRLLIYLYTFCQLDMEFKSFCSFSKSTDEINFPEETLNWPRTEVSTNRQIFLGYFTAEEHPFDSYREKSYRNDLDFLENSGQQSQSRGYIKDDSRPYFDLDILIRLNEITKPSRQLLDGSEYIPPILL